jgi:hypothetical protein
MKTGTLSTRVDKDLLERLDKFERETLVEKASLVRASLTAVLDHYDQHGSIVFPLIVVDSTQRPTSEKREVKLKK